MITVAIVYVLLAAALAASLIKSRDKTKAGFVFAWKALMKTVPALLGVLGLVGLTLGLLPQ